MSTWIIAILSISYLGILFFLAAWAEKNKFQKKSLINNPLIYALSLSIYCSAWTFYGSVGQVATNGINFLTVYLGPTFVMILAWGFVRKMIRIAKVHYITNIADFISSRYGKDNRLGQLVTLISVFAGIPYIGLQLKAISESFDLITASNSSVAFYNDPSFFLFIAITLFILTLGPRKFNPSEKHEGMIFAIGIESIIKIVAFLAVGIYITYVVHDGWGEIFTLSQAKLPSVENQGDYGNWFIQLVICGAAFLFLPRVFHVAVVEISEEEHLKQASWIFPLYMVLINFFVIPIGFAGFAYLSGSGMNPDLYVLGLPLHFSSKTMAVIVFIGGFSAATGMVILETIAISSMISNNLFMPILLQGKTFVARNSDQLGSIIHNLRRLFIVSIMIMAYVHYRINEDYVNLVSIGMTSFLVVAQFAPTTIIGLYWKNATRTGAIAGISIGFLISSAMLFLPSVGVSVDTFRFDGFNPIANAGYWSLSINLFTFVSISILTKQSAKEANPAYLFVDVFNYTESVENSTLWRGKAKLKDLKNALAGFMGKIKADASLKQFANLHQISLQETYAHPRIVNNTEKLLAGFVGSTSARLIISAIAKEENIGVSEVVELLQKSRDLQQSNVDLRKLDAQKNEFLTTVTHEIRSSITSIRSLSEIMVDHEDISAEDRKKFLDTIIQEADRLSRLVNQVLDLEKLDAGKQKFYLVPVLVEEVIEKAMQNFVAIAKQNQVNLTFDSYEKRTQSKVLADFEKLVQVVVNIMSNAIKNVEPGTGKISIQLKEDASHIFIEIRDNGIGIDPKFHDKIFEKFKQMDNPNKKIESSGLGLSISKKIIEHLNGTIQVHSSLGQGALFLIKLPIE